MMYQAITTKYIAPSNVKGSRVKASAAAGSVTLHWDNALNTAENHLVAARKLAEKFKWHGEWYGGGQHNTSGFVFVLANQPAFKVAK